MRFKKFISFVQISTTVVFIFSFIFFAPTVQAVGTSNTKTIGGCMFTTSLQDSKGKTLTKIAKNSYYYVVTEWSPGIGTCDDYVGVRYGYVYNKDVKSGTIQTEKVIQECYIDAIIVGNKKVAKYKTGTGDDPEIYKYVHPLSSAETCLAGDPEREPENNLLIVKLAVTAGSTTGGGGGGNSGGGGSGGGGGGGGGPIVVVKPPDGTVVCYKADRTTVPVGADGNCPPGSGILPSVKQLYNPIKSESLVGLSLSMLKFFTTGIAALAVVFIVMGSFRLVLSRGNPEAVTRGKDILIWSVAGLLVALMGFSLISIVQNLLGAF